MRGFIRIKFWTLDSTEFITRSDGAITHWLFWVVMYWENTIQVSMNSACETCSFRGFTGVGGGAYEFPLPLLDPFLLALVLLGGIFYNYVEYELQ